MVLAKTQLNRSMRNAIAAILSDIDAEIVMLQTKRAKARQPKPMQKPLAGMNRFA